MSETTVWAFKPLKALNGETGFVVCDHDLADKLVESGEVQDPRVGALHFKEIQAADEVDAAPKKRNTKETGDK
jgi:hypothetical protein